MIPRLQRFYGGRLSDYRCMEQYWLRAYVAMMGPIQAEENIRERALGLLTGGRLSKQDAEKLTTKWQREVQGDDVKQNTTSQALRNSAQFGIGVMHVDGPRRSDTDVKD